MSAQALREAGNAAFGRSEFAEAAALYTQAIALDDSAVLRSNRSASRAGLHEYSEALADADAALKLQPGWNKAHYRRGVALDGLRRFSEAAEAFAAAAAVAQPGSADEQAMLKLQFASLRRTCLSDDGATLTAHFSFDDDALLEACAAAKQTLRTVDATAALALTPSGVAAAVSPCAGLASLSVAFPSKLTPAESRALGAALPAGCRLECPTEALFALPSRPPADPSPANIFSARPPPPISQRAPMISATVEAMRAHPLSLLVQGEGASELAWLGMGNQMGVANARGLEAIAAALRAHAPLGRAYGKPGRAALAALLMAAQTNVAATPEAGAQFVAAGGVEAATEALRTVRDDHFGVSTHGWGLLDSVAARGEPAQAALARMAACGTFALAAEAVREDARRPSAPRAPGPGDCVNCVCTCTMRRQTHCHCVAVRIFELARKAGGAQGARAAAVEAGLDAAIEASLANQGPAVGWTAQSLQALRPAAAEALAALRR